MFKEKQDNVIKGELIKAIIQKNNNIADLQYQIENYSNLLSQAEQYGNITKEHSEDINQIVTQYNQFHYDNADHINKTLKAFIATMIVCKSHIQMIHLVICTLINLSIAQMPTASYMVVNNYY